MTRRGFLRLSAIAFFGLALLPGRAASQQQLLDERIVGTWAYVSSTAKLADGSPFWGANPKGLMIFTPDRRFSWQVFRSDRPKFAGNNRMTATPDENKATMQGSLA